MTARPAPALDADPIELLEAGEDRPAIVKRRPFRRQQILDAAVRLFNEKGYHATGMNDIGEAIGITGPGIYRHFKNKEAILETALLEAGEQMAERVRGIVDAGGSPRAVLDALVDNYVETLLEYPAMSATVMAERRNLSDSTRAWVNRNLRLHAEEWVTALLHVRPELSDIEARVIVMGVFGMYQSVERFWGDLERERLANLLKGMATATLFATLPDGGGVDRGA
jgi:AcrR family transcriptional regulator